MNNLFKKTALATALAASFGASSVLADEASTKGGIKVKSDDGQFVGEFGGRMHVDANFFSDGDDFDNENGTDFRRLRLQGKATMYGQYEGFIQVDFGTGRGPTSASSVTVKDAYLAYSGFGPGKLYLGQVKIPMGLEELTSSNYITFMERSMVNEAVNPTHRRGIQYAGSTGNISYAAMAYGGDNRANNVTSAPLGLGTRVTWTPMKDKVSVLHVGASLANEFSVDTFSDVSTRYETRLGDAVVVLDTPAITDADDIRRYGLEAAYASGPFSAQAEYLMANVDSSIGGDPEISGYYLSGSYFLTGESRPYKASTGTFDRVKPIGKSGAWEATLRYSTLEGESDTATIEREVKNITAGLNWYMNPQVRLMFNLSQAEVDEKVGAAIEGDPLTLAVRAQFDF